MDRLGLQSRLRGWLWEAGHARGEGIPAGTQIVYVDCIEMTRALQPAGTYTTDDDAVISDWRCPKTGNRKWCGALNAGNQPWTTAP